MKGADYSSGHPSSAQLKAAGVGFVCRYLSNPGNPKNLTPGEAQGLRAAGIKIVTVFESTAGRALAGYAGGVTDARKALHQAQACGMPVGSPIYFAIDFDATAAQQKKINAYLNGAASVLGHARVGVYGGYDVVKRSLDGGFAAYAWQTTAWSGGKWDARAHIRQQGGGKIGGVSVDYNSSHFSDFGQWRTAKPKPPPKPKPKPKPKPNPKPLPKRSGHWAITVTTDTGFLPFTSKTLLGWCLLHPRLAARGWRRIDAQWIETA